MSLKKALMGGEWKGQARLVQGKGRASLIGAVPQNVHLDVQIE